MKNKTFKQSSKSKDFKKIPTFETKDKEREFWETADTSEYFDFSKARHVDFPNLKPTSRSISLRIPEWLINRVKEKANEINVPYQSLMKEYIHRGIKNT